VRRFPEMLLFKKFRFVNWFKTLILNYLQDYFSSKMLFMKTGKETRLRLSVALNVKASSVVTVNDYLAERDQKFMEKVYKGLGLTVI
jgi:ABC-type polysaccharide/polyol phosphate transport system ATPase subunit